MIPSELWPHVTIEEINSLTEDESCMLLFICNVWAPIRPPMPTEENPHPLSLDLIRSARRIAIIDRVIQAKPIIKDESIEIYNGLRIKLNIPNPPPEPPKEPVVEPPKEPQNSEINNGPVTGSNIQ